MSSADPGTPRRAWSLTARLTALCTVSAFGLLLAAALFLDWELTASLRHDAEDGLRHKVQVLTRLIGEHPANLQGIRQEALDEAEVSTASQSPFFLRVLDAQGRELVATRGMSTLLPPALFAGLGTGSAPWHGRGERRYLLAAARAAAGPLGEHWSIQAAFDVSMPQRLLIRFHRDLALMLLAGLLVAASVGAWVVRRGLTPLSQIAALMEPIGATDLGRRIAAGSWPAELQSVALAFDRVLDRLQESFGRLRQFSADLAHELRTPINTLMGEAQVALSRPRSGPEYERVLQSSLEELQRVARMIDSMLFLAQADQARMAVRPAPLSAAAQLQAVADFYQALAEEQAVSVQLAGDASLAADPALVRRALSNLISNALRHTPRGGLISLQARHAGRMIELEVRDNGAGIPPEHHGRLGDRFFRVEGARGGEGGSGLGLAIVRSIMDLHGGQMRIDSEPGRGTRVTLSFPDKALPCHAPR